MILVWIFVSFAILIFYLSMGAAVLAGILTILVFKRTDHFLDIFKPGLLAGSTGILLVFAIGSFFEATVSENFIFDFLWLIPLISMSIGLCIGTVRTHRKLHDNLHIQEDDNDT